MTDNEINLEVAKILEPHQKWEIFEDIYLYAKPPYAKHVGYRYPAHTGWIMCKNYAGNEQAAVLACLHMAKLGWHLCANMGRDGTWECFFSKFPIESPLPGKADHYGASTGLARAICMAFLNAFGKWKA